MDAKKNIVEQIRERIAKMAHQGQRGVILQPGAIGDCILTMPLAEIMKETVCRGGVDIIGHTEYTGVLPGRSCVDAVRSMDSMQLHRLFAGRKEFELADGDPLIMTFINYTWIVTFLGQANSDFEQNLIFTVNCSHSAEVMPLEMKPKDGYGKHISEFYIEQFIEQSGLNAEEHKTTVGMPLIRATPADMKKGRQILAEHGVIPAKKPIIFHPGSGGEHKCWNLENFLSVAREITTEQAEAVFLLGPAEQERFESSAIKEIASAGRLLMNLSLVDVLAVLSCARGYIGNDSGITHLAAALGIRTAAVFGPTDPAVYRPLGPAVTILRSEEPDFEKTVSKDLQKQAVSALLQ